MKLYRRGKNYYLRDGALRVTLHTTKKGVAEFKLRQYLLEKHGMVEKKLPTVGEYYEKWIETKREPMVRRSLTRSYRQHFGRYILAAFSRLSMLSVSLSELTVFRAGLLRLRLSVKTVRNIFASFQAFWRDASAEYPELKTPFANLQWPRVPKKRPAAFTVQEVAAILAAFKKWEPFYLPWVLTQFATGMRPSEQAALTWADVVDGAITIGKSRDMGTTAATKTARSERTISLGAGLLPPRIPGIEAVFVNKYGRPVDPDQLRADYWGRLLKAAGVEYKSAYHTRHTFITEMVKRGENIAAIAQYCGTSAAMIEQNYCGRVELNGTKTAHTQEKPRESLASPTGFELVMVVTDNPTELLTMREHYSQRKKRSA